MSNFTVCMAFVAVALLTACGDSSDNATPDAAVFADAGLGANDLVGAWQATSFSFTDNATPAESWDLIADAGGAVRATVLAGGGTRMFIESANGEPWVEAGNHLSGVFDAQWGVVGTSLRIITAEVPPREFTFAFMLEGNTLTLTNGTSDFDFTHTDATPVAATEVLVMTRE